jgi:hypothetical protein
MGTGLAFLSLSANASKASELWKQHSLKRPEDDLFGPVIGETTDKVSVSDDGRPHVWEIPSATDYVDFELELQDDESKVDVILVSDVDYPGEGSAKESYKNAITPAKTHSFAIAGRTFEFRQAINLVRTGFAQTEFNQPYYPGYNPGFCPLRKGIGYSQSTYLLDDGTNYLIIDNSDVIGESSIDGSVTADISIRARREPDTSVEEEAQENVEQMYVQAGDAGGHYSDFGFGLANTICDNTPDGFKALSLEDIRHNGNKTGQLKSLINAVFTYLRDAVGFEPTFLEVVLSTSTRWLKWGMSVAPMLSSAQRLVEAACEATSPSTNDVEERLKEMYLNLGILVADIVFAAYGLTGRLASAGIRLADTYILGFLKKRMGLKSYLLLLRELHQFLEFSLREIVPKIKAITNDIVETEHRDFFDREERSAVSSMGTSALETLDIGVDSSISTATTECTTSGI